jgi:glycosyltransferase involved in cell wall biosynthesis
MNIKPKPRVLFVLGILWGKNGITSHLETLVKRLMARGWEVSIASGLPSPSRLTGELEEATLTIKNFESMGVKHYFVPFPDLRLSFKNIANFLTSLLTLNQVTGQFKPDVIHIHSLSVCPYVYLIRLLYNIPYVSTCHMELSNKPVKVKLAGVANKYFRLIFGDRMIAISSEIKNAFERMKVPAENIRLIYHGVDSEHFRPPSPEERLMSRETFGISPESKVICFIGRLDVPVKGHDVLIRAISKLRSDGLDAIALCAGKGYGIGENIIQSQATEEGVSDLVRLLGFADARQVLWASDVLVLPSRREGFALVIPEAMLCGIVPVRTPAAGAADQIEDGINGFVVPFDDPEALALRLKQLLENDRLRSRMSAAAIETARQKFTVDKMIDKTIAVFAEIL